MGFPRILSKNNKIYTKLGEFCLAGDHFWIVCHTCQEELQTQAQFWKHIQDEHNFLLNLKHIEARSASFVDADTSLPLPLYRKLNEDEQREEEANMQHSESKDYADMRVMEPSVEIDIKLEPSSISSQPLLAPPAPVANATTAQQQQQQQPQQIEISAVPTTTQTTLYQLTQTQVTPVSAYATIMHTAQPTAQQLNSSGGITVTAPASALPLLTANATNTHELAPKDSNSTTASASSGAVSSDDGERWYICDYENCGLKFKYQSRLELHRAVHSKERRFACELCGASFKQSCNLSTHRKKKHALKGVKAIPMQNNSQQAQIQQQQHQQQQQQQAQQQQLQQQRF